MYSNNSFQGLCISKQISFCLFNFLFTSKLSRIQNQTIGIGTSLWNVIKRFTKSTNIQTLLTAYRNNNNSVCYLSTSFSFAHTVTNVAHADLLIQLSLFRTQSQYMRTHNTRKMTVTMYNACRCKCHINVCVWNYLLVKYWNFWY